MEKEKFDLVIIGGGAGGFAAAIRANELEAKTVMVNSGLPLGGTCVNVGCVPSKILLFAAEVLSRSRNHRISGLELEVKNFAFPKIMAEELSLVEKLRQEKYEKVSRQWEYVTFIEGSASFMSSNEVEVNGQKLLGKKFIIAAGSTAVVPPIKNILEVGFVTHVEALRLKEQPKELIVVGAGPLGLEFSQMFNRFGTKVAILQREFSIFSPAEKELTNRLRQILEKEGITIKTNVEVKAARKESGKKILSYLVDGKEEEITAEEILLAAGKMPNTSGLGLDKAGVRLNERKGIIVNQYLQTSKSHVYAVGDVVHLPLRLESTAGHEGTLAAENALTGSQKTIDYNTVPYTIFTDPQLASVGLTEEQQIKNTGTCACRTVSFDEVPKAMIMRQTEGLIKMAIHPQTKQILGVHILAPDAGEIISQAMVLIKNKNTIEDVVNSLPMFPTLSEAIKIAALSFTKDISRLSCCI